MLTLARYMKERWPTDLAGNVARHQLGLFLIREKNVPEAIKELSAITKEYPSYTIAQYQLAEACDSPG
jgi:predicted Zn-dependent protease